MGQLSGVTNSKRVIVGGGGGTASGSTVSNTPANVVLFTTPTSPTDSEYVVRIAGVVFCGASSAGAIAGASAKDFYPPSYPGASSSPVYPNAMIPVNHEVVCGPGAAVGIPVVTALAGSYQLSYSYAAYKAI